MNAIQSLIEEYEDAYVIHLEASECDDLEDRLQSALRVSDLAARMQSAGLTDRMHQIHSDYRD